MEGINLNSVINRSSAPLRPLLMPLFLSRCVKSYLLKRSGAQRGTPRTDTINALTSLIKESLPSDFDHLLFSYHGIPERHVKNTDPSKTHCLKVKDCCNIKADAHQYCYRHQVLETTKLCAQKLNIEKEKWSVSFQSRIGPGWLKPFTDKVLDELPKKNIKKLAVVCPAFVADNLETLEEINIRAREQFIDNGGIEFTYIPCLNDNNNWVDFLSNYIIQKGG